MSLVSWNQIDLETKFRNPEFRVSPRTSALEAPPVDSENVINNLRYLLNGAR